MVSEMRFIFNIHNDEQLKNAMEKPNVSLLCLMEADFFILADQKIFFVDQYINVLELIANLEKPIKKIRDYHKFAYKSMDYDEPILEFKKVGKDIWEMRSIWSYVPNDRICFEGNVLMSAFEELCLSINEWLKHFYGVSIEDVLRVC